MTCCGELGRLDDAHLGSVRGEFVGEDVHVDVRHADALLGGRGAAAEAQRGLGARVHLEQGGVACGDLLEAGEGALARALAQRGVEATAG